MVMRVGFLLFVVLAVADARAQDCGVRFEAPAWALPPATSAAIDFRELPPKTQAAFAPFFGAWGDKELRLVPNTASVALRESDVDTCILQRVLEALERLPAKRYSYGTLLESDRR